MVQRLQCASGRYRFEEMALEYQLTRPGLGREYLGSLLDPLDDHPDLLDILRPHIGNNLNRQRTARLMHVHTNAIDYRLNRRIDRVRPHSTIGPLAFAVGSGSPRLSNDVTAAGHSAVRLCIP